LFVNDRCLLEKLGLYFFNLIRVRLTVVLHGFKVLDELFFVLSIDLLSFHKLCDLLIPLLNKALHPVVFLLEVLNNFLLAVGLGHHVRQLS
jgi:hypothetical protein